MLELTANVVAVLNEQLHLVPSCRLVEILRANLGNVRMLKHHPQIVVQILKPLVNYRIVNFICKGEKQG